jgi:DNA-binding transcriptional regulator GbsR (MarR family)
MAEHGIPEGADNFIEGSLFFEGPGVSRIGGRIIGLPMISDRPRSLENVAELLDVSRASVSTNARSLVATGLVQQVSMRGEALAEWRSMEGHAPWEPR